MFRKGDYISIIEKAYNLALDDKQWIRELTEAVQGCLGLEAGLAGICFDARFPDSMDPALVTEALVGMSQLTIDSARAALSLAPPSVLSTYHQTRCATASDLLGDPQVGGEETRAFYEKFVYPGDTISICCTNPDRTGVVFSSVLPKQTSLPRAMTEHWMRVASHVAAGLRLRRALGGLTDVERQATVEGEAILDPSGKLQHAGDEAKAAPMRESLRRSVIAVDRARGRLRKGDPELAVDLWKGLVSGRWSLVDRFDSDGRHYYVACRNDPALRQLRALTLREKQVLTHLAMGDSNKMIAYKLGLSKSAVGAYIASAKKKLGVPSRTLLVRLVSQFGLKNPRED